MIHLHIYLYLFFFKFFSGLAYYRILSRVPCPCWLSVLNTVVLSSVYINLLLDFLCQCSEVRWAHGVVVWVELCSPKKVLLTPSHSECDLIWKYGLYRSEQVKMKSLHMYSVVSDFFCNPVDCSPQVPSVHGISQARILEEVAISSSRASSQPSDH